MPFDDVQTLVLRSQRASGVAHLVLSVAPGGGGEALRQLAVMLGRRAEKLSVGLDAPSADSLQYTLGFTYRGLEALGVPVPYLRVFSRLAGAYSEGAPLRAARLGDNGASAETQWNQGFQLDAAHVLVTLHGPVPEVHAHAVNLYQCWNEERAADTPQAALTCAEPCLGELIGAPPEQDGEWVHFGYRDGLSDRRIDSLPVATSSAGHARPLPVVRKHAAGEFLTGHANDSGFNPFGLPLAPAQVRAFFHDSSFGVLRPILQNVQSFEQTVKRWRHEAQSAFGQTISADWVKAKLCGRWPSGEALRPGQWQPVANDFDVNFAGDDAGTGCPWASHVRRMTPQHVQADTERAVVARQRTRPLVRRGVPFGPAVWANQDPAIERGLLGQFFCASLEDQFEHLLGQWANRRPLGARDDSLAKDPLIGQHEDTEVAMLLPRTGSEALALRGFGPWTRTLGTAYAWYPNRVAVQRILEQDYLEPDTEGPWT